MITQGIKSWMWEHDGGQLGARGGIKSWMWEHSGGQVQEVVLGLGCGSTTGDKLVPEVVF